MLHETFQFQRELCESTFSITTSVQENCETLLKETLELSPWLPAEGKKVCLYLSDQYWSTMANLKGSSLMSLDYVEKILTPSGGQTKSAPTENKASVTPPSKSHVTEAKTPVKAKSPVKKKTTRTKSTNSPKRKTTAASTPAKKTAVAKKATTVNTAQKKSPAAKAQNTGTTVSPKSPAEKSPSSLAKAEK